MLQWRHMDITVSQTSGHSIACLTVFMLTTNKTSNLHFTDSFCGNLPAVIDHVIDDFIMTSPWYMCFSGYHPGRLYIRLRALPHGGSDSRWPSNAAALGNRDVLLGFLCIFRAPVGQPHDCHIRTRSAGYPTLLVTSTHPYTAKLQILAGWYSHPCPNMALISLGTCCGALCWIRTCVHNIMHLVRSRKRSLNTKIEIRFTCLTWKYM